MAGEGLECGFKYESYFFPVLTMTMNDDDHGNKKTTAKIKQRMKCVNSVKSTRTRSKHKDPTREPIRDDL